MKQDPETGDYLRSPKRKKIHHRNSHEIILSLPQLNTMTRIFQNFHIKYANIIVDKAWAFPTEDPRKMLPALPGEAPRRSMYSHINFNMKGIGSNCCLNKPGVHNSSKIRFVVDYEGNVYQNCWSSKICPAGKPCCRVTTKGKQGFMDKIFPCDYEDFVGLFSTTADQTQQEDTTSLPSVGAQANPPKTEPLVKTEP